MRLGVRDLDTAASLKSGNTAYHPNSAQVFGAHGRDRREGVLYYYAGSAWKD